MIDTHSHIYAEEFDLDREAVVARALAAGVATMLLPAIDSATHERELSLVASHGECCRPMIGLHPTSVDAAHDVRREIEIVEEYLRRGEVSFCGVGEIGLDFYWSEEFRCEQIEVFRHQIELALMYDLPIAVHTRSAWAEMIEVIESYRGRGLRGVFHAYSDTIETYRRLKSCGEFWFGIGGVVTFKRSATAEVVREMELDDILLESDCPYLTPEPFRGRRNESSYIPYICARVAEIKGVAAAEVADATTLNARRCFNL